MLYEVITDDTFIFVEYREGMIEEIRRYWQGEIINEEKLLWLLSSADMQGERLTAKNDIRVWWNISGQCI